MSKSPVIPRWLRLATTFFPLWLGLPALVLPALNLAPTAVLHQHVLTLGQWVPRELMEAYFSVEAWFSVLLPPSLVPDTVEIHNLYVWIQGIPVETLKALYAASLLLGAVSVVFELWSAFYAASSRSTACFPRGTSTSEVPPTSCALKVRIRGTNTLHSK